MSSPALAAVCLQGIALGIEVVVAGGGAGMVDNHAGKRGKNRAKSQRFCHGVSALSTGWFSVRAAGVTKSTVFAIFDECESWYQDTAERLEEE